MIYRVFMKKSELYEQILTDKQHFQKALIPLQSAPERTEPLPLSNTEF